MLTIDQLEILAHVKCGNLSFSKTVFGNGQSAWRSFHDLSSIWNSDAQSISYQPYTANCSIWWDYVGVGHSDSHSEELFTMRREQLTGNIHPILPLNRHAPHDNYSRTPTYVYVTHQTSCLLDHYLSRPTNCRTFVLDDMISQRPLPSNVRDKRLTMSNWP